MKTSAPILLAEDDENDILFMELALERAMGLGAAEYRLKAGQCHLSRTDAPRTAGALAHYVSCAFGPMDRV